MSNVAVRVEHLGKRYRIGSAPTHDGSLRDALVQAAKAPFRNLRRLRGLGRLAEHEASDIVWALKDVSFEVKHGEALGIIGRNGAGKSTLLKILSRITEPSKGRAVVHGRVGSLLEVGTGFHPELTGRDNVYLNGSILGMDRAHIDRKFDEIVAFSGVERYVDTPVKRYSSGMYLRLAFAVAAHLEPEVLVVDEVLAVGDAEFQKKCLGKMGEVAKEGRTVLFVSHHMGAVRTLCDSVLLLRGGCSVAFGDPDQIIAQYLDVRGETDSPELVWPEPGAAPGTDELRARALRIRDGDGRITNELPDDEDLLVEIEYEVVQRIWNAQVGFQILTADGTIVMESYQGDHLGDVGVQEPGSYRWACRIPGMFLNSGQYYVKLWGYVPDVKWLFPTEVLLPLTITQLKHLGADRGKRPGIIRTPLEWQDLSPVPAGRNAG
jgi:lipopolysaccharide transport system ATP-binding protein